MKSKWVYIILCFVLIAVMLVCCGAKSSVTTSCEPYTLTQGDTIWGLWQEYGQAVSWRQYYEDFCETNNRPYGYMWHEGENVTLLKITK